MTMQDSSRVDELRDILDEIITAVINSNGAVLHLTCPTTENVVNAKQPSATAPAAIPTASTESQHDSLMELGSLEADGPADSWLLGTEVSDSAAQPGHEHMFCKGPSWNQFVDKLTSPAQQQRDGVQASGGPSTASASASRSYEAVMNNSAGVVPSVAASTDYASPCEPSTESRVSSNADGLARNPAHDSLPTAAQRPITAQNTPADDPADMLQTPVRSAGNSSSGTLQEAESAAWMASLRSAPTSSSSSRRLSRTQSASGASPHTPNQTSSKLAHSRSARVSAPGANITSPDTPASAASSKSLRQDAARMSASRQGSNSSSKYSLRRSCPTSLTAAAVSGSAQHAGTGSDLKSPVTSPTARRGKELDVTSNAGKVVHSYSRNQKPASSKDNTACSAAADSETVAASSGASVTCSMPSAMATVPKAAARAKAAADAAKATSQELMQSMMRMTADSAADVPLPAAPEQDEGWAADTTAVQLFMDAYKDVLDAVDDAYTGCSTEGEGTAAAHQEVCCAAAATAPAAPDETAIGRAASENLAAAPAAEVPPAAAAAVAGKDGANTLLASISTVMPAAVAEHASADVQCGEAAAAAALQPSEAMAASQSVTSRNAVQADSSQQQPTQQPVTTPACGCGCTIM